VLPLFSMMSGTAVTMASSALVSCMPHPQTLPGIGTLTHARRQTRSGPCHGAGRL
jgi:hypothetical protein